MPRHGKKYSKSIEGLDTSALRTVEEAVKQSLESSFAKFDETAQLLCRTVWVKPPE